MDPVTYDQYRLTIVYERTERRGPVFERLRDRRRRPRRARRDDGGVQAPSRRHLPGARHRARALGAAPRSRTTSRPSRDAGTVDPTALAELASRLARAGDLDTLVSTTVRALADLFGHEHSMLLLLDEDGTRLFTIASHGYDARGRRVGGRRRRGADRHGRGTRHAAADREPPPDGPVLADGPSLVRGRRRPRARSRDPGARPARRAEPPRGPGPGAGSARRRAGGREHRPGGVHRRRRGDAHRGGVARRQRGRGRAEPAIGRTLEEPVATRPEPAPAASGPATRVRFFEVDGSTFLDGDYLIKGVAGRILWALLGPPRPRGSGRLQQPRDAPRSRRSTCRRSATTSRAG